MYIPENSRVSTHSLPAHIRIETRLIDSTDGILAVATCERISSPRKYVINFHPRQLYLFGTPYARCVTYIHVQPLRQPRRTKKKHKAKYMEATAERDTRRLNYATG